MPGASTPALSSKCIWFCNVVAGFARSCPAGRFRESPPWGALFKQEDDDDGFDIVVQRMDGFHRMQAIQLDFKCTQ